MTTKTPSYNGGEVILGPDSDYSNLELEIMRSSSGIYFFINLLLFQATPSPDNPSCTVMEVSFDEEQPIKIYPLILEGGQKLLLSPDTTENIIQSLLNNKTLKMLIGRNSIVIVPNNFEKAYTSLLALPIEEYTHHSSN